MSKKLVSISAFWNNHGDDGIAVMWKGGNLEAMAATMQKGVKAWHNNKKRTPVDYIEHLKLMAEQHIITSYQKAEVAMHIMYLSEIGAIPDDNYNGMLYIYEGDE